MNNKILVICERPILREGMEFILREANYSVDAVSNRTKASQYIKECAPPVIIIDQPSCQDIELDPLFCCID